MFLGVIHAPPKVGGAQCPPNLGPPTCAPSVRNKSHFLKADQTTHEEFFYTIDHFC